MRKSISLSALNQSGAWLVDSKVSHRFTRIKHCITRGWHFTQTVMESAYKLQLQFEGLICANPCSSVANYFSHVDPGLPRLLRKIFFTEITWRVGKKRRDLVILFLSRLQHVLFVTGVIEAVTEHQIKSHAAQHELSGFHALEVRHVFHQLGRGFFQDQDVAPADLAE